MSTNTSFINNTIGDKSIEIVIKPNITESSPLISFDSLLESTINTKNETFSSFVETMDNYIKDVPNSQVETKNISSNSFYTNRKIRYQKIMDDESPVTHKSNNIRIERPSLDEEYGEFETDLLLSGYTSENDSHIGEKSLRENFSDLHYDNDIKKLSILDNNQVELQEAIERSFSDLNYNGGFTELKSFNLSNVKLPSYGWYGSNSSASKDCTLQQYRRKFRTSFANTNKQDALFCFLKFLLVKAKEQELMSGEFDKEKNFVFEPYFPNSYWYKDNVDDFSSKSQSKKIGIKTTLNKYHANLILSIFYILYSKFELTTDENIFEKEYRDGVLMRDDNFELFKFFDKIIIKFPNDIDSLSSLVNNCLDIFNHFEDGTVKTNFFGDDDIQYQVWLLTFSNQVKEVIVSSSSNASFYTISDLIDMYDDEWYASISSKKTSSNISQNAINTSKSYDKNDNIDILDDLCSESITEDIIKSPIHQKNNSDQIDNIKYNQSEIITSTQYTQDVFSSPSSPVRLGKKKSNTFVDGVISNLFSFLKIKND